MSNFERRLSVVQRRPVDEDVTTAPARDAASSTAWQAAERVSHLPAIEPGTTIKIDVVAPGSDEPTATVEVRWDAAGVPLILEGLPSRRG